MVSETQLKQIVDRAKKDPAFFNQMFSDPQAAMRHAGVHATDEVRARADCAGVTCMWTCSWTGQASARAASAEADCWGITCNWTCSWTGTAERKQQASLRQVGSAAECGGITCSWTCSFTGMVQAATVREGVKPGAIAAADCGGPTCSWTCSFTGLVGADKLRDPVVKPADHR